MPVKAIAFDDDGNRAAAMGGVPEKARGQGLTATYITEQMFKTGGTPYNCVENRAQADPGLYLPASEINDLRRRLVSELSEQRAKPPIRRVGKLPEKPKGKLPTGDPAMIFQVLTEEQLSPERSSPNTSMSPSRSCRRN